MILNTDTDNNSGVPVSLRIFGFLAGILLLYFGCLYLLLPIYGETMHGIPISETQEKYKVHSTRNGNNVTKTKTHWVYTWSFQVGGQVYTGRTTSNDRNSAIHAVDTIYYLPTMPQINKVRCEAGFDFKVIFMVFLGCFLIWFTFPNLSGQSADSSHQMQNGVKTSPNMITQKSELDGMGVVGFSFYVILRSISGVFSVLFSFTGLLCIGLLALAWFGIPLAKQKWPEASWIDIASMLTYAKGGLTGGGRLGAFGGILGKALIGSAFIGLLAGPSSTNRKFPEGNSSTGLSSFASWLLGIGFGLILFNFTNINMLKETSFIGLIMFFACLRMQSNPSNLTIAFFNSFAKGRPFNPRAAKYCVAGIGWGFLIGFGLVWLNSYYPQYVEVLYNNKFLSEYVAKYCNFSFNYQFLAYELSAVFVLIGGLLFII